MGRPPGSGRETRSAAAQRDDERVTTLRLTVEYDGTEFCGFQWQPGIRTVAGDLEAALSQLFREPVKTACAGRTDAGVHATGQVVSCTTAAEFPFERLALALNTSLAHDISVRESAVVADDFSARFSALERTYVYAIFNRRERSALLRQRAYHVYKPLDIEAMRVAAAALVGERDFRSFCGVLPEGGVTMRTVRRLAVERTGDFVRVEVTADGFLHHMVRTIVGTLIECGWEKRRPDEIPSILAARDRAAAGHNAPPQGLYLAGVRYENYDSYRQPSLTARLSL